MKFKTYTTKDSKLKDAVAVIGWSNNEDVYSCSEDQQVYKWSSTNREMVQVAKLPEGFIPTDLHWLVGKGSGIGTPGAGAPGSSKGGESLLIAGTDGRFIILNKSARIERNVLAHTGPIVTARWSPDGAGLLSAGEDGIIKIWSRSGMLRSTVVQNEGQIRCAGWSPSATAIVYCQGPFVAIKPLAANSKLTKWRAHEGMVLCLAWSNNTGMIGTGGEDCRYKIWDTLGTNVYTSVADDYAITSIDFCPDGELLAIDSTQIASSTSTGSLLFGHIIERELRNRNLKAITTGRKTIQLQDIVARTNDTLDFSERIIKWELGYGHLVVATVHQVHIFNEHYVNTPIIIDGRSDIRIVMLGKKHFILVDYTSIWIYTYTGRLNLNPRYPGSQAQIPHLNGRCISLGMDSLAVRDHSDQAIVHVFDLLPGATRQEEPYSIQSKSPVVEVAVCRFGNPDDQYLVYIDANQDLYITSVHSGPEYVMHKIGTQITTVMWSSDTNILVGLHDLSYTVWYCPGEACADPTLIALTTFTYDTSEFGKNITLENFEGANITLRSSGAIFTISVKTYCVILHKLFTENQWERALKLCRLAQNHLLWATLAAMASKRNQLEISEEAFSASLQIDKVNYLNYIKSLSPSSPEHMAENSIMNGRIQEAEIILMHNKRIPEAIRFCLRMHRWNKALEVALKHGIDVEMCAATHKHTHTHTVNKERTEDGAYAPRDAHHMEGGEHYAEFDHEAILGSVKEAEEFDNLSPEESKKRLTLLVVKMDQNSDGYVDRHELKAWILRSFKSLAEEEASERFEDVDLNNDETVTWDEYLQETYGMDSEDEEGVRLPFEEPRNEEERKLVQDDKEMFEAADTNRDGKLDSIEFVQFISPEEFPQMLPIILQQTLRDKDTNKDGRIDFQEFVGDNAKDHDKEWLVVEMDKFKEDFDKNNDGFLSGNEILSWVVPSNDEVASDEVDHLFAASDDDHDDRLSHQEIIDKYDIFVGSEATDYGDHLQNIHHFDDEL
uniref:Reticulocalbin-3 n=1 Tax=Anopheles christyi TaxID=43041 RepID=A0A182JPQ0_9DIPT